jgi:hypothetical protein
MRSFFWGEEKQKDFFGGGVRKINKEDILGSYEEKGTLKSEDSQFHCLSQKQTNALKFLYLLY